MCVSHLVDPRHKQLYSVPNPLEADAIRLVIAQADTDKYYQGITRIKELLARLQLRRAEMEEHCAAHRTFAAPERQCPDEILSEIFIHCNSAQDRDDFPRWRMPWLVGMVCRRWREVAMRTAALWSDITVVCPGSREGAQREAEKFQELLQRTGISMPISLQIWGNHHDPFSDLIKVILPAILPSSNRWHHLHLTLTQDETSYLSSMKGALVSLESLALCPRVDLVYPICDIFEIAPRLSRVHMECSVENFKFPWTQLTYFSVKCRLSLNNCLTILNDCPHLVSGVFDGAVRDVDLRSRFRRRVIHHTRLRHLTLATFCGPSAFFDCLSTPALRTIHLHNRNNCTDISHQAVVNFLLRSSCTIASLKWNTVTDTSSGGIGLILRAMPELEELEITHIYGTQFVRQLLLDLTLDPHVDGDSNLCTRLHTIGLYSPYGFDKVAVLEFVKSRKQMHVLSQSATPLRSVTLRTGQIEHDEVFLLELQLLRDEGLDIVVA